ncbi:MAG: hypothetical protein Q4E24_14075 [bacterium]|nr:hypothetical protein [bacterium]
MSLKTDYKDAMYDGQKRYQLIKNEDGTYGILDATVYTQNGDRFGANDVNAINTEINKMQQMQTVLVPASAWSATAPYTQTLSIEGITEADSPVISFYLAGNNNATDTVKAQNKAYGFVDRAVTGAGSITLYCYRKKPAVDFRIAVKGA